MSAFLKIACALFTGLGGSDVPNVNNPLNSRARARGKRGSDHLSAFFSGSPRSRRPGLFRPEWLDLVTGERKRATRLELREAYRLWAIHRDIRLGQINAEKRQP
jgi:hypothetical protein